MHWVVKSWPWYKSHRPDDPATNEDWHPFLGVTTREIISAWAIVIAILLILLASSVPSYLG